MVLALIDSISSANSSIISTFGLYFDQLFDFKTWKSNPSTSIVRKSIFLLCVWTRDWCTYVPYKVEWIKFQFQLRFEIWNSRAGIKWIYWNFFTCYLLSSVLTFIWTVCKYFNGTNIWRFYLLQVSTQNGNVEPLMSSYSNMKKMIKKFSAHFVHHWFFYPGVYRSVT